MEEITRKPDKLRVEVDYYGNTYLRFRGELYNIFFDIESKTGIDVVKISDSLYESLKEIHNDHYHMRKHVKCGKIVLTDSTLKGRVTQILSEMDQDELNDEAALNMLSAHNSTFKEEGFFRVERDDNDMEEDDDWDIIDTNDHYDAACDTIEYRFCGVRDYTAQTRYDSPLDKSIYLEPEICFSDVLSDSPAHNDVIMIRGNSESKVVTSCSQRIDGFCTQRLVFYSDGMVKVQFPSSHVILLKITWKNDSLSLEVNDRKND